MRTNSLVESSPLMVDPHAEVEKMYMAAYLTAKGYTVEDLARLPAETARVLLEEASLQASLRLAELETGAALAGALHQEEAGTAMPRVEQANFNRQRAPKLIRP